jgi:hypothetical protein
MGEGHRGQGSASSLPVGPRGGAPAHFGLITDNVLQRAQAQGWGQRGFPIAARILEAMAGVELRAPTVQLTVGYQEEDPRRE